MTLIDCFRSVYYTFVAETIKRLYLYKSYTCNFLRILSWVLMPIRIRSLLIILKFIYRASHSSLHVASLIGKRTSIVVGTLPLAYAIRQVAESYGLGHKLASLRPYGHTTAALLKLISKHRDRLFINTEAGQIGEDITTQCIKAIEKDRVDSLILGCEPTEIWEDDVRQRLDAAGYDEIPLICPTPACVQMARAIVSMGLKQTPRAYPTDTLRAQQEYA